MCVVNRNAGGVNEKVIVGKLKPVQVPQVKNGEQSPLQSLSW